MHSISTNNLSWIQLLLKHKNGLAHMEDHLWFLSLVFLMLSRLFIAALWPPAGKGLTSWLLSVTFIDFCYFPMWYLGSGVVLDCLLIFAI